MKRCWIGAGLLLVLLLGGIFSSWWMGRHHSGISEEIDRAGSLAVAGDLEQAQDTARLAKRRWDRHWGMSASLTDHEPMELVDSLFAQLETYGTTGNRVAFAGICAQLASELEALGDAQGLTWWNLL